MMVIFKEIYATHTTRGEHVVVYEIDFDAGKLGEFVKDAFIKSKHYPFTVPYGSIKISVIGGKPVLVHEYDTSD